MPIRNRLKVGDYLMVDDITGQTHYASEMVRNWDGAWVHHSKYEPRQPQDFVKAGNDPEVLRVIRSQIYDTATLNGGSLGVYVGNSTVRVNEEGAAAHLYDFGIGEMQISTSFIIR